MNKKFKNLLLRVETLEQEVADMRAKNNKFMLDLSTRKYLIKTDFFGGLESETSKNRMRYGLYGDIGSNTKYTFDEIVEQISGYQFEQIENYLVALHLEEQRDATTRLVPYTDTTTPYVVSTYNDPEIDTDEKISGTVVTEMVKKPAKKAEAKANKKGSAISAIDKYYYKHFNEYYINNLQSFYSKMNDCKYPLSVERVVTLINAIKRTPKFDKLAKDLDISEPSLNKYLLALEHCGIIIQKKPVVLLNNNLILTKKE